MLYRHLLSALTVYFWLPDATIAEDVFIWSFVGERDCGLGLGQGESRIFTNDDAPQNCGVLPLPPRVKREPVHDMDIASSDSYIAKRQLNPTLNCARRNGEQSWQGNPLPAELNVDYTLYVRYFSNADCSGDPFVSLSTTGGCVNFDADGTNPDDVQSVETFISQCGSPFG